jgi:hypothetical protein
MKIYTILVGTSYRKRPHGRRRRRFEVKFHGPYNVRVWTAFMWLGVLFSILNIPWVL